MRVFNFSAGPSMMPEEVLKEVQKNFCDYKGSGMSVTEFSHRSDLYYDIHYKTLSLLRELMDLPEEYAILLMTGGASTQFDDIPLNLMNNHKKADYIVTGYFSNKAYEAAQRFGDIKLTYHAKEDNYTKIPKFTKKDFRKDIDYVHITGNNTVFGLNYKDYPEVDAPLCLDVSSNILGQKIDFTKFDLIYAGAQKNISPAGVTIVAVKKSLINNPTPYCPLMQEYRTHAAKDSIYNTPPVFPIYMASVNLEHLKKNGGVKYYDELNKAKSGMIYDLIDNSKFYTNNVEKPYRSIMNVRFNSPSAELDAKFIKEAADFGLVNLKGHKATGGMRASMYNGMPIEGAKKLAEFMKKFELENK